MFAKKIGAMSLALILTAQTLIAVEYANDTSLYPKAFPIIERKGYTLQYDGRNRIPLWTQEHLTKENVQGKMSRGNWRTDTDIYEPHRSTNADYTHSGFQRGHMVPDADRDNSRDVRNETYLYSNACPQEGDFNRGIWAELEQLVRDLVMNDDGYESVDVITGPLFVPYDGHNGRRHVSFRVIGDNDVAVPSHYFKVIYANYQGRTESWAYLLPVTARKDADLNDFIVDIEELETLSGLQFGRK